jgi:hypothetical protein
MVSSCSTAVCYVIRHNCCEIAITLMTGVVSGMAITTHDSGLAGLGSGGVTGKPDVEKRQLVAELQ